MPTFSGVTGRVYYKAWRVPPPRAAAVVFLALWGWRELSVRVTREKIHTSEAEVRHGIEGTMCRCTGYQNIVAAVREAATRMKG